MQPTDFIQPRVSFIIPVLNASKYLQGCIASIYAQDYRKELIEIIIADGGSTDNTAEIAKQNGAVVVENKKVTSESGKAIGIKASKGEYIVLIDSDNLLPTSDWLKSTIRPLIEDNKLIGSEPLYFTYRKGDGFIDRYCALMGMNDPLCYWLQSYDRMNVLSGKWTGLNVRTVQKNGYIELELEKGNIPTIGANGTIFRKDLFEKHPYLFDDYYFDMDILETLATVEGPQKFAKVGTGVVHLYCGNDLKRFAKKQLRRVKDFLFRAPVQNIFTSGSKLQRTYTYGHKNKLSRALAIGNFILSCLLIFPLVIQAIIGYSRKNDWVWIMHPVMCWITLLVYTRGTIESLFNNQELSRKNW